MFIASLILFALVLLLLGIAATRGLSNIDEVLTVVDTREPAGDRPPSPIAR